MKIVAIGGPLAAPYVYDPNLTVCDALDDHTAQELATRLGLVMAVDMHERRLLQEPCESLHQMEELGIKFFCLWEAKDWEAQFKEMPPLKNFTDWEPCEDTDQESQSAYLGTYFNLSPSGKFYTPWANSNLAACPVCDGAGDIANPEADKVMCDVVSAIRGQLTTSVIDAYGAFISGHWPPALKEMALTLDGLKKKHEELLVCEYCGGCGHHEAHQDELWRSALEEALSAQGLGLVPGEGDPCDLFAVRYRTAQAVE